MTRFQTLALFFLASLLVAVLVLIALVLRPQAAIIKATTVTPLEFHGDNAVVYGPLSIPDGIYIAKGRFAALATVRIVPVSGECTGNGVNGFLFMNVDDYSGTEKQAAVTAKGCVTLIEVFAGAPWSLSFTPIQ